MTCDRCASPRVVERKGGRRVKNFSEWSDCKKCGQVGAKTEYKNVYCSDTGNCPDSFGYATTRGPHYHEWMLRTCNRCGYQWRERTNDADR